MQAEPNWRGLGEALAGCCGQTAVADLCAGMISRAGPAQAAKRSRPAQPAQPATAARGRGRPKKPAARA